MAVELGDEGVLDPVRDHLRDEHDGDLLQKVPQDAVVVVAVGLDKVQEEHQDHLVGRGGGGREEVERDIWVSVLRS